MRKIAILPMLLLSAFVTTDRDGIAKTIKSRGLDVHAQAWRDAIQAIATSPKYGGLTLKPQLGLVPLGPDRDSKLWEFAHLKTGTVPKRDADTGKLKLTVDTGLVLVLIPAGTFSMGAQKDDPKHHPAEDPAHDVTLGAFFLSKYEMTQAQWKRVTGKNPSRPPPPIYPRGHQYAMHPVETVSWAESTEVLGKLGLILPTEAQWEYAARAGTTSPWWTGQSKASLTGAAVLILNPPSTVLNHSPIVGRRPNPWGLADVYGNVSEWCRDWYADYDRSPRARDGLRGIVPTSSRISQCAAARVTRGGGFCHTAFFVRSAFRSCGPGPRHYTLGVRPSKRIEP